jgi:hypothetical protein
MFKNLFMSKNAVKKLVYSFFLLDKKIFNPWQHADNMAGVVWIRYFFVYIKLLTLENL